MSDSRGLRFDWSISLGAVLQAIVVISGFAAWLVYGSAANQQTQRDVAALQAAVARQTTDTRGEIKESLTRVEAVLAALQAQIAALPDMAARVRQLEIDARRLEVRDGEIDQRFEGRRAYVDAKLDELRRATIEASALLDSLRRGSAVNLPGARGIRP